MVGRLTRMLNAITPRTLLVKSLPLLLLALAACTGAEPADDELSAARERWESSGIAFYEMRLERQCECLPEWSGPIEVTVENRLVTSALFEGQPAPEGSALTIDELFDEIEVSIARGVENEVTYHPDRGYPLTVRLDLDAMAVDGGLSLNVLGLAPIE